MNDREIIGTVLDIQRHRGWSDTRLCHEARIRWSTWEAAADSKSPTLHPRTRAKLTAFVAAWPSDRPHPLDGLIEAARAIQQRREWSSALCADLANVTWSTWQRVALQGHPPEYAHVRAGFEAFVATWSDDSRPLPRRYTAPNGNRFGQLKVTSDVRQAIVESPYNAQVVALKFGLSSTTVYRIRLREREQRVAS